MIGPAQNLDQRALSGAVFAQQRQHFSRAEAEIHPAQGLHPGKHLTMFAHRQERRVPLRSRRRGDAAHCKAPFQGPAHDGASGSMPVQYCTPMTP